jgi:hypothetical protein
MKNAVLIAVAASLGAITGCSGSSGSTSIVSPPPVSAQSTYSNAAIDGTYSVLLSTESEQMTGTLVADGKGNFTQGSFTDNPGAGSLCTTPATGSYGLSTNASGTATITLTSTGTGGCNGLPTRTLSFNIEAGQQGNTLIFGEVPGGSTNGMFSGSASKQ